MVRLLLICCIVFLRLVFLIRLDDSYTLSLQERETIVDIEYSMIVVLDSKNLTFGS